MLCLDRGPLTLPDPDTDKLDRNFKFREKRKCSFRTMTQISTNTLTIPTQTHHTPKPLRCTKGVVRAAVRTPSMVATSLKVSSMCSFPVTCCGSIDCRRASFTPKPNTHRRTMRKTTTLVTQITRGGAARRQGWGKARAQIQQNSFLSGEPDGWMPAMPTHT